MTKDALLRLAERAVAETGFLVDRDKEPWMPKLADDDFRSVFYHGWYKGKNATLKASPHENYLIVAADFERYNDSGSSGPSISVPPLLRWGKVGSDAYFMIQEMPAGGKRMLPDYPFSTKAEKQKVAQLYWHTAARFREGYDFATEYFLDRLHGYVDSEGSKGDAWKGFIGVKERDKAMSFIMARAPEVPMRPFFTHFSNTDIVEADGKFFIQDATIAERPECYGAAFWMWGATMHAYREQPSRWLSELDAWIREFMRFAIPQTDIMRVNLVERFLATLLVDLPLRRSPFDKLSDEEAAHAGKIVRAALEMFLI